MFWGAVVTSEKPYDATLEKTLLISHAVLSSLDSSESATLVLKRENQEFVLCHLYHKIPQQVMNLCFQVGDHISFSTRGTGVVHLTGYFLGDEDDYDDVIHPHLLCKEKEIRKSVNVDTDVDRGIKRTLPVEESESCKKKKCDEYEGEGELEVQVPQQKIKIEDATEEEQDEPKQSTKPADEVVDVKRVKSIEEVISEFRELVKEEQSKPFDLPGEIGEKKPFRQTARCSTMRGGGAKKSRVKKERDVPKEKKSGKKNKN